MYFIFVKDDGFVNEKAELLIDNNGKNHVAIDY